MTEVKRSLTMMVYGPSKSGKSTLAATAPYPRLMLDVEYGHKFLPLRVKYWDPMREEPPVADGTWDTCVVPTRSYDVMLKAYQWLQLGRHQFRSVIIDSISELQVKLIDQVAGNDQLKMQHWGELLRAMSGLLRDLRDLTMHPTNPLEAIVLTSMQREGQDGKMKPYLQGQVQVVAPYLFDILGYIRIEEWPNQDPMQPPHKLRRCYIESTDFAEAGERVQGRLGTIIEQSDLNVETLLNRIYGPRAEAAPVATANDATYEGVTT